VKTTNDTTSTTDAATRELARLRRTQRARTQRAARDAARRTSTTTHEHAACSICGTDCSTHPDAANPIARCGDCGGVTCLDHRVEDAATRCVDCAATFYATSTTPKASLVISNTVWAVVGLDDSGRYPDVEREKTSKGVRCSGDRVALVDLVTEINDRATEGDGGFD
jgi:hypothetical protein